MRKNISGKAIGVAAAVLLALCFLFRLDVTQSFYHGFFTEARPFENLAEDAVLGEYPLSAEPYVLNFTPQKDHFAGVVLYLELPAENPEGLLELKISAPDGKILSAAEVDLSAVKNEHAYKVEMKGRLQKGSTYQLEISAKEGTNPGTALIGVNEASRMPESADNALLIGYAYASPDFTDAERLLITLFVISGILLLVSRLLSGGKKTVCQAGVCLFLITLLAWNFSYNSLDDQNVDFESFQEDSERLVTGAMEAVKEGIPNPSGTGLVKVDTLQGSEGWEMDYPTDDDWNAGYHRTDPAICIRSSDYQETYVCPGNQIRFADGETASIVSVQEKDADWVSVALDMESPLDPEKLGSLTDACVLDASGNEVPAKITEPYASQYGLQGKVFQHLVLLVDDLDLLHVYCALGTAAALFLVAVLVARQYSRLLAGVFYAVFLLSPWVVNFANNLYWVEFTWFLPMAAGLFCAGHLEKQSGRVISYVLVFLAVMIKCLCGYEYITTVMMGSIAFLLVELAEAAAQKEAARAKLLFRTIFLVGLASLLGFVAAICLHAPLKSGGDLVQGIRMIIQQDVLRRTYGADLNAFENLPDFEQYALTASAWETLCRYFHFKTEVIAGIGGNLFPLLCLIPVALFVRDFQQKTLHIREPAMYVVFFLTSVSWFLLAKSHSYVHVHMNFVLWYFGYVQICLYVIIRHLADAAGWGRKRT